MIPVKQFSWIYVLSLLAPTGGGGSKKVVAVSAGDTHSLAIAGVCRWCCQMGVMWQYVLITWHYLAMLPHALLGLCFPCCLLRSYPQDI